MRVTVKIGSNVLARRDGSMDVTRMSAIVDQVSALREAGVEVILISSGAVACGRSQLRTAKGAQHLDSVSTRQLFSAVGQVQLINRYSDLFRTHGFHIGQVLTTKESFATRVHYLNQRNCMSVMLDAGIIPVVNENDTVSITELMFTDNDELSGLVATMMDCDTLIILSNIDGIFTGDPDDPASAVIRSVDPDKDLSEYIQAGRSGFGRGGMVTKYNIARKVAAEGIRVIIANGKRENILTDILLDNPEGTMCTEFRPSEQSASSLKRWIAHSEGFAKGTIHIDDRARDAIMAERATSLLPIGVTAIEGQFEKDDLVRVADSTGHIIAVGRVSCSSTEADAIKGLHNQRPLIHYDYLSLDSTQSES